eukprot:4679660-Pyramimonas_sp.AAC.1
MRPRAQIKIHQDSGRWVLAAHRIHVPIVGNQVREGLDTDMWLPCTIGGRINNNKHVLQQRIGRLYQPMSQKIAH